MYRHLTVDRSHSPQRPALAGFFIWTIAVTDFKETEMRKMCRNPHCGCKLPAPVSNPREAFCCRGCHTIFYRKRCLVCEEPMERKSEHQKLCKKAKCRNAYNRGFELGRYGVSKTKHPPKKR
jgi:hypothetical protein